MNNAKQDDLLEYAEDYVRRFRDKGATRVLFAFMMIGSVLAIPLGVMCVRDVGEGGLELNGDFFKGFVACLMFCTWVGGCILGTMRVFGMSQGREFRVHEEYVRLAKNERK